MRQSLPRSLALLVLGFFLAAPAHAGDEKDKSPEDVFKAVVAAMKKQDMKAIMSHLTRDSQTTIAGLMVIAAASEPWGKRGEEARKAFDDVLKRHGISSDEASRKTRRMVDQFWEPIPDQNFKNLLALGEMVKDKPAFVDDVLKLATKYEGWKTTESSKDIGETKIKDVKIDKDQAKGESTMPNFGNSERTQNVYFKLENGVWKIDLVRMIQEPPSASPPRASAPAPTPQVQPPATPSYSRPGPLRRLLDRLRNW
jgi:hypothetical protein